jgi:hypothetical protein
VNDISKEHIRYALSSNFAGGDVDKALELLRLQHKAFAGIIQPYNPNTEMVGAENRGNVTCYLDSLLFAMFARLDAFECMLKNDASDENQRKLAALVRLWVNMLRSGKLIHVDMVSVAVSHIVWLLPLTCISDSKHPRSSSKLWLEGGPAARAARYFRSLCLHYRNTPTTSINLTSRPLSSGQGRQGRPQGGI